LPAAARLNITGPAGPAQIDDDPTVTARPPAGRPGRLTDGTGGDEVATGDDGAGEALAAADETTARRVAVIASADVPNGNRARIDPPPSRSTTSAVWDIEYSPGVPVSSFA
jgi:hypothetical protein